MRAFSIVTREYESEPPRSGNKSSALANMGGVGPSARVRARFANPILVARAAHRPVAPSATPARLSVARSRHGTQRVELLAFQRDEGIQLRAIVAQHVPFNGRAPDPAPTRPRRKVDRAQPDRAHVFAGGNQDRRPIPILRRLRHITAIASNKSSAPLNKGGLSPSPPCGEAPPRMRSGESL